MIKRLLTLSMSINLTLCVLFCVLSSQTVCAQTYEIHVGDKRTLYAPTPPMGTIDYANWSCSNNNVWISEKDRGESAVIKVAKYFTGTATITCSEKYTWYDSSASVGNHYKSGYTSQTYSVIAKPTKVFLNKEELELEVGDDFQFTYTTEPSGLEPIIEWHCSNNNVASFSTASDNPGWLETWSEGTCTITAIGNTGEKDPTCLVTVVDNHWVKPYIDGKLKAQGTVKKGTEVMLTSTKSGATIYYTTDESEPTKSSIRYTTPIVVNKTITIKAKAYLGNQESKTSTFKYTVASHLNGDIFTAKTKEGVDLSYVVNNGYLEVSSGSTYSPAIDKNYSGKITIPYKVDDMVVRNIGERAFYGCNISSVEFEEYSSTSVSSKSIGKESFRNCANLKNVTLPHGITLGSMAFYNCITLEMISFNGYASYSGSTSEIFNNCNNLKDIYLYYSSVMKFINDNTFSNQAYNEATLHVPEKLLSNYKTLDGWKKFKNIVAIGSETKQKITLTATPSGGEVTMGATVTLTAKTNGSTISGCDIYYTLNGSTPTNSSTKYTSSGITINEDCTLKAVAYKDGYQTSDVLAVDYTVRDNLASGDGSLSNPFNAVAATKKAGELGVGETSSQNYYVKGKISSIKYTYSAQYGTATFYISDDGTTNDQFYVYGSYYLENKPWVEGNPQIEIGDAVIVYGKMTNYNGILEMADKQNFVYSHNGKTNINTTPSQKLVLYAYPGGGQVAAGTTITLTAKVNGSAVSGCDIYYTLNGTSPSKNNGSKYSYGITINESCTLKAIAYKDGYETSDVLTLTYTVKQTPSNEYYYYVGNMNGWNVLDATYYFTKVSDGKTWELTMPCDKIYSSNGNADEFKIGTAASLVEGWSVDVYGASDDNPSALKGTMSYIGGPNFQVPFIEGMYSYTIRIVPSTMQYEIAVNTQESAEVVTATCAEVNAGTDGTIYRVTGNVKSISNAAYGNWYLEDSTGELFIYGTRDKEGNNGKNNSIDVWGIETGDIITVEGPRQKYNGKVELVDVSILSLQKEKKSVMVVPANGNNSGCYATFYSSRSAYTLPNGLSAQVVTGANNSKLTYKTIADGSVSGIVPKGTAVMLVSDTKQSGTFSLTPSESTASYSGTNLLHGSDEPTTTTGDGYHYKLSYGPTGTQWDDVFGWYWGAQNGEPFQIEGRKAWLVIPRNNGTRSAGFSLEGETLGIGDVNLDYNTNDDCYDLQGRHVSQPTKKGIYIRNGHKIVNR